LRVDGLYGLPVASAAATGRPSADAIANTILLVEHPPVITLVHAKVKTNCWSMNLH